MRLQPTIVFAVMLNVACAAAYAQSYKDDAVVELKGILISSTADPAITIDEQAHQLPALQLHKPINVLGSPKETDCKSETGIMLLHLVLRPPQMAQLKNTKGKSVRVRGTLFHSHTGYHFTSVLLDVESITP